VAYESLIDRLPESRRRDDAHFRLAVSHHKLPNPDFHGAEAAYRLYLNEYPEGRHRVAAQENLSRLYLERDALAEPGEERLAEAREQLDRLLREEALRPQDAETKYRIGNLFYELGHYDRAGHYYFEAQKIEAAYQQRELVQKRLFINERGEPETYSPAALLQDHRNRNPLVVFDVHRFNESQHADAFLARQVYQTLTGKVRNQGAETVRVVVVEIHFLNAVNDVLDVRRVAVGDLAPGEVRAFWGRGASFDRLSNLDRVRFYPKGER
jgi:tetratricopeptide (TPR) repeat protein